MCLLIGLSVRSNRPHFAAAEGNYVTTSTAMRPVQYTAILLLGSLTLFNNGIRTRSR